MGHLGAMHRPEPVRDPVRGRPHRKLRISVTDRCALRCSYCVPEGDVEVLPRASLLSFEEIARFVASAAVPAGLVRLRLTGGEPLQRRGLADLARMLRSIDGVERLGLTTNAERLAPQADDLARAGVDGVNISLDTLNPVRFRRLTGIDAFARVIDGIEAAVRAPFSSRKLNAVAIRGVNDDELGKLVRFGLERGIEVRFIEFMPFGGRWGSKRVVPCAEIAERVTAEIGPAEAEPQAPGETARTFHLAGGGRFGVIPTMSEPFCSHCDRVRLSADGHLMPCLFATTGVDVRRLLREGADPGTLRVAIDESLAGKGVGYLESARDAATLKRTQNRNMKTIGG